MPFPPRLRTPLALLAAVTLTLLLVALAFRGWDRYVEDGLARWAVGEVARRTGGAYRLGIGELALLPLAGSISFDAASLVTDSARNRRRKTPLPTLEWRAQECRVSGLDVLRLLVQERFSARELGCRRVVGGMTLVPPAREEPPDSEPAAPAGPEGGRPLGLKSFRIAEVSFPALSLTLERPREGGGTSVVVERARFAANDLVFRPSADPREHRTLSADRARLTATGLVVRQGSPTPITIAGLEADLIDGTLRVAGVRREPAISEDEWVRQVRVRRNRVRLELDTLRGRGVAWRALIATGELGLRALEVRGLRLDVLSDRRIPKGAPIRHRTPQQVAARPGPVLRLDTLTVTHGTIVYREREPETDRPGRVTFDRLRATITHLDLPSRGKPLRVEARALVMNAGLLTAEASVPLDAPDFRYELAGRLGPMPAAAFNRFLSVNEAFELDGGRVEEITFRQTVERGRAVTTVTPRYRDLSVEPTGSGGGPVGSVTRALKEFVAQTFVVRSRNPDEDGDDLRTARSVHRYDARQTWIQFLWFSLRDGLLKVVKE